MTYRKRPEKYEVIWGRKRLRKLIKADNSSRNFQTFWTVWLARAKNNSDEWWKLCYQNIRANRKYQKRRVSAYNKTPDKLVKRYNKKRWKI